MKLKERKGITLIALVITIIVLLILAGVTIATLTGENGILTQAQKAKTTTANKSAEEKVKLAVMAARSQTQDASLNLDKLKTEVTTNYGGQVEGTEFPVTVAIDGKSFTVDGDGDVSKYDKRAGIKVGDYVDYKPDTESGKTYDLEKFTQSGYNYAQTVTKEEDLNWRVLRKNDDGSMDLIGDETNGKVCLGGSRGYNNGVYILNDICKELYSNKAHNITARSVNLEDMEKWLTPSGKEARAEGFKEVKYGETKQYKGECSYAPVIYGKTEDENANYYSEPITENTIIPASGKATDSDILNAKQTCYNISINLTNYGDGEKVLNSSNVYWVAARFVGCASNGACFGLRTASSDIYGHDMFYSYGKNTGGFNCLRPVVSLGSDVQITRSVEKNDESHKHTIDW